MDLLPSSHTEFSQPDYWDRFFKKRGKIPFEWYGEYPQLHKVIHKYITPANQVLVVGCGNSALSEDMYDNGLQNLVNIDISDIVIRQMNDKHREKRPKMTFEKMDVTQMTYSDGQFNVVLDKGTLDALLVSEERDVVDNVHRMFDEISRCLRLTGRYIVISLLQQHVQNVLLQYFTKLGWPIRIHRIQNDGESSSGDQGSLSMPVFAVIITKLKAMPNMPQIVEVCRFEDKIDRLEDVKYLSEIVRDMQYYHIVRQQLKKRLPTDQQVSLELHTSASDTPRYTLTVVDSPNRMENKFAIFIVPQGRETEWLFSTDKGRLHLLSNAGFERLVVVTLSRGHEYENLDAIKAELSLKVMELAPPNCPPRSQVPFLSIGEDIGKRYPVAQGESVASGPYLVEDVVLNGGQVFRRLVFLNNQILLQSESRMVGQERKKKKRRQGKEGPPENMKIDKGYLPSEYLIAMAAGLAFLPSLDEPISAVMIGLGGGNFPSFLQSTFPKVTMDAVELDPTIAEVATNWFELVPDERLKVHVADGMEFIRNLAMTGERRDLVFLDVDAKDQTLGLNCPPSEFVEVEFLNTISAVLTDHGIFVLNLACQDESLHQSILQRISQAFTSCACVQLKEDINTIVFAGKAERSSPSWQKETLRNNFARMDSVTSSVWKDSNVDIVDMMEQFRFLE